VNYLILNQYRSQSGYKDILGELYHFPNRYLNACSALPSYFIYYEPRTGGDQVYFGCGILTSLYEDTEDANHSYAEIREYTQFETPLSFYSEKNGGTWEPAKNMRNSVRKISQDNFLNILKAAGVDEPIKASSDYKSLASDFVQELKGYPGPGKRSAPALKRIKRLLETYERPSFITNELKRSRGDQCQLCGTRGFIKRDGKPYCEVHHLFHLAKDPPPDCLSPEYLVVLCANCHRKMHYAEVKLPVAANKGWIVNIDGVDVFFDTSPRDK
jgi:5-methylcytosine-specific restriction endonuclease McrA